MLWTKACVPSAYSLCVIFGGDHHECTGLAMEGRRQRVPLLRAPTPVLANSLRIGQVSGERILAKRRIGQHGVNKEAWDAPQQHVVAAVTVAHILAASHKLEVGVDSESKARRCHGQVGEDELAIRGSLWREVLLENVGQLLRRVARRAPGRRASEAGVASAAASGSGRRMGWWASLTA